MSNDSTTAGFLVPADEPAADITLDDQLHDVLVGIIGRLPDELVRPRWQPNPPNRPMSTTNWLAFGVVSVDPDVFAYEGHDPEIINGEDDVSMTRVERDELLSVLLSFYGPDAMANDSRLRAGLDLAQNRATLHDMGIGFVEYQAPRKIPALMKETWVPRVDATLVLRRRSVHRYNVRTLQDDASGMLDNEQYLTPIKIPPAP